MVMNLFSILLLLMKIFFFIKSLMVKDVIFSYMPYKYIVIFCLIGAVVTISSWFGDMINEALAGFHQGEVTGSFKMGMIFFISSEILFFFSFFWFFFHVSLTSDYNWGFKWIPFGISFVNPMSIPLLNSLILISSGFSVTMSHYVMMMSPLKVYYSPSMVVMDFSFLKKKVYLGIYWTVVTVLLGFIFLLNQLFEYKMLLFSISDSSFGSIFFISTGFHGIHVLLGVVLLLTSLVKMLKSCFFSVNNIVSFEMSIWYWHFVDVVWLFLYFWLYWFSSKS